MDGLTRQKPNTNTRSTPTANDSKWSRAIGTKYAPLTSSIMAETPEPRTTTARFPDGPYTEFQMDPIEPPPPYQNFQNRPECVIIDRDIPYARSEEQVREAILEQYKNVCCFDKNSVELLRIHDLIPNHAFRYGLETFIETRTLEPKFEPFTNDYVDLYTAPVVEPELWSLKINPPDRFVSGQMSIDLPRTATVVACHKCQTPGGPTCPSCNGLAFTRCVWCCGTGRRFGRGFNGLEVCGLCSGEGRINCSLCRIGRVACSTCKGYRYLRNWMSLNIKWTTDIKFHQTDREELNSKHFKHMTDGDRFKVRTRNSLPPQPYPIHIIEDASISMVSNELIREQLSKQNQNSKVLEFRQTLEAIPVLKFCFTYKGKDGHGFVYGNRRLVYFPNGYPVRAKCCGCTCCFRPCSIV